jgi:hypothetical protein
MRVLTRRRDPPGSGDTVSATSIRDPNERFSALTTLLGRIEERHGLADWVAVSDTDEFWWTPDTDLRGLLAGVPEDAVCQLRSEAFSSPPGPSHASPR